MIRHGDASLREWKRAFLLETQYSPTRRNVLGLDIFQDDYAGKWFRPDAPHRNEQAVAENLDVIRSFCSSSPPWRDDPGHKDRTRDQVHLMTRLPAIETLTRLLAPLRIVDLSDSVEFTGLLLQLQTYLEEHPGVESVAYQMSGGRERRRSLDDRDEIDNLFQGRNPLKGPVIYPGDMRIQDEGLLSVQIHMLRVPKVSSLVAAVAVWLPR